MVLNERQQLIIETLLLRESATVVELSEAFDVSTVTIRNDLNQLAELGYVTRTHGGARIADGRTRQEITFSTRQRLNAEQKQRIGERAANLVQPLEPVLLDASTTAVAVGRALKHVPDLKDITVVTTGIWTALELLDSPNVNVVLAGGHVRPVTGSIAGSITRQVLDSLNFNKVFLGAWGLSIEEGATDTHLMEIELKQFIIERAREVILVVDGSKFGRLGLASFAPVEKIDKIVTDDSAPHEVVNAFREQGVDVVVATPET